MLLCNMYMDKGLCNGSRGVVRGFDVDGNPRVKFVSGQELAIGKHTWTYNRGPEVEPATRVQIPLALAWVRTSLCMCMACAYQPTCHMLIALLSRAGGDD
jgi:hypothetical protein